MGNQTSTLTTSQDGKEAKRKQAIAASLFNDTMGFFEQSAELILEGRGEFVNQVNQMAEHRIGEDRPPERLNIGGETEIPFNKPDQARYQQILEGINVKVEQVSEANKMLNQSVREVSGMNDEELAKTSRYNNEDYRGENLRSTHNLLEAVKNFFQDLWNRSKEAKEKTSFLQTFSKRTSSKGAVSGANDLLLNAQAQEGQSATSSAGAVRGAG